MDIISCDKCGVVLDADVITEVSELYKEDNGYKCDFCYICPSCKQIVEVWL